MVQFEGPRVRSLLMSCTFGIHWVEIDLCPTKEKAKITRQVKSFEQKLINGLQMLQFEQYDNPKFSAVSTISPFLSLPPPRMEAAVAPYPPSMAAELAQSFTLGGETPNRDRRRHSPLEVTPFAASGVKLIGAQPTGELRRHRPSLLQIQKGK